ncbi:MAG: DUF4365 domain-containing protein [Salinivirgaceae bacterium]|jgi:hypothetical protein
MPHRKQNIKTEFQGVNYIAQVLNSANCIFNKIDGSNDIGLDGYIEFVENESATGLCIGVQIKSGESYQNGTKSQVLIPSDKNHLGYWKNHLLPIIGIVYIPSENQAYWIDITKYLNGIKNIDAIGSYTISIPKDNIFSIQEFSSFYKSIYNYKVVFNKDWNFGKALKLLVPENGINDRIFAIKSLFHFHRNDRESWFYLVNQFRIEADFKIQKLLIFTIRHLISHGDIFWHKDNILSEDITNYGRKLIKDTFNVSDIGKLLNHIDEAGITRGSMGQNIYPLIDLVTNKVDCLKEVIMNDDTSDNARTWAGVILINEFQHYDIDRAIKFADSMLFNFPDADNIEQFTLIKEALTNDGFVDFTG